MDRHVDIGTLRIDPPLVNGSGAVDISAPDTARAVSPEHLQSLGAYVTKTVTLGPTAGHPPPWVQEIGGGTVVNAVGLANPGAVDALHQWAALPSLVACPVIVSIGGKDTDAAQVAKLVERAGWPSAIELNLSCPNHGTGVRSAAQDEVARSVELVRAACSLPLLVKLAPSAGGATDLAREVEQQGADAIVAGNTLPAWMADEHGAPLLGVHRCGMSGPALHPVALRLVADISSVVDIPVVGLGGVGDVAAARRMLAAGASIVGVGTAAMLRPGVLAEVAGAFMAAPGPIVAPGRCRGVDARL